MSSIVVIGHVQTTSKDARDKALAQLDAIQQYSRSSEPGVLKYAITVPRDEGDETTIVAIEEYETQQVSDDHLASGPVQDLIKLFGSEPILKGPPQIYTLQYSTKDTFVLRPNIKEASDVFYTFAITSQGSDSHSAEFEDVWRHVIPTIQNDEPDTLLYALLRDPKDGSKIYSIEGYSDKAAFEKHCQSKEVADMLAKSDEIKGQMSFTTLKLATGWISR